MEFGPMMKKADMKNADWIKAYENNNVDIGLKCGFMGIAQIGKGMFAEPDNMNKMMYGKLCELTINKSITKLGNNVTDLDSLCSIGSEYKNDNKIDNIGNFSTKASKGDKRRPGEITIIN